MASLTTTQDSSVGFLTREERLDLYRTMLTSRALDDAEIQLKRLNRVFFPNFRRWSRSDTGSSCEGFETRT